MLFNICDQFGIRYYKATPKERYFVEEVARVTWAHQRQQITGIKTPILPGQMKKFAPYMFANTGIVNLVISAQITDLFSEGVFANCKQLETVVFENLEYNSNKLGAKFFYGCSKLKEIELPYGINNIFNHYGHTDPELDPMGNYIFANCTALEKVTVYSKNKVVTVAGYTFYNCTNLKELNLVYVHKSKFITDENGKVIGYGDPAPFISTGTFSA
ncbi:MAG: leucine-rich repeat domain-containing protein, partial [Firmicutes bacterium]|nr:leucine-rich repeat domain-containing protein [Bacillota bacterium]